MAVSPYLKQSVSLSGRQPSCQVAWQPGNCRPSLAPELSYLIKSQALTVGESQGAYFSIMALLPLLPIIPCSSNCGRGGQFSLPFSGSPVFQHPLPFKVSFLLQM